MSEQRMYIKHSIGGQTFFDGMKREGRYEMVEKPGGTIFRMKIGNAAEANELVKFRNELNIFVVDSNPHQPQQKTWYYTSKGQVEYDSHQGVVEILADGKITYPV